MSNMIDRRKKMASNEQDYAHQYPFDGQPEAYKYPNDDKRVQYKVESDSSDEKSREELYNLNSEKGSTTPQTPATNKIRVRMTKEEVTEDHRQQSYKVKSKPPVYDKTDSGSESFQLKEDPRQQEVQYIQQSTQNFADRIEEDHQKDLTSPNDRFNVRYKDSDDEMTTEASKDFRVGMKVAHLEEGLAGEIKFVNDKRVTVAWEDNTRERFSLSEAREFLAYVDSTQEQVAPTETTPFPKKPSEVVEKALSALEGDTDEDQVSTAKIDIEKAKLQRKVNELQHQVASHDINKIKTKAANELINLMQKKGMLSQSEEEVNEQFNNIMAMDDAGFESFKNAILKTQSTKDDEADEIYALLEDHSDDDIEIEDGQEYAKRREEMKKASTPSRTVDGIEMGDTSFFENGGLSNFKGTVGDFSSAGASTASSSERAAESRNLSSASSGRKGVQRTASERRNDDGGLDLSGFKDLQGLKAPINIPSREASVGGKFSELFSSMDWTIISKK